jgi:hypothetical protein
VQVDALKRDLEKKTTAVGTRVVSRVERVEELVASVITRIDSMEHRIIGAMGGRVMATEQVVRDSEVNSQGQMEASAAVAGWGKERTAAHSGSAACCARCQGKNALLDSRVLENVEMLSNKMDLLATMVASVQTTGTLDPYPASQLPRLMFQAPPPRRPQCMAVESLAMSHADAANQESPCSSPAGTQ